MKSKIIKTVFSCILLLPIAFLLLRYLWVFDFQTIARKENFSSYQNVKITAGDENGWQEFTNTNPQDVLNLLHPLKVRRQATSSSTNSIKNDCPLYFDFSFYDQEQNCLHLSLDEHQLSFSLPKHNRRSSYRFNTYRIKNKEQYRKIAEELFQILK